MRAQVKADAGCAVHGGRTGERRIRVLTLALPVTNDLGTLYSSASAPAMANLLAKMGTLVWQRAERGFRTGGARKGGRAG